MRHITIVALIAMFKLQFAIVVRPGTDLSGSGITVDIPATSGTDVSADDKWKIPKGISVVDDWGIEVTLDALNYGFNPSAVSSITITVNLECTPECDEFYSFGLGGDRFISFAHDGDNGIRMYSNGPLGGLFIYPADGSNSFGVGNPKTFLNGRTILGGDAWTTLRSEVALNGNGQPGIMTNGNGFMTSLASTKVLNSFPVTFNFKNDPENGKFRVTFSSPNYVSGKTAVFNTAAAPCSDFRFYEVADPGDGSAHKVWYTVTSDNTGGLCECAEAGEALKMANGAGHVCQCQSECSDGYCNSIEKVATSLEQIVSGGLCSDSTQDCCCSCPNCSPFVEL